MEDLGLRKFQDGDRETICFQYAFCPLASSKIAGCFILTISDDHITVTNDEEIANFKEVVSTLGPR